VTLLLVGFNEELVDFTRILSPGPPPVPSDVLSTLTLAF